MAQKTCFLVIYVTFRVQTKFFILSTIFLQKNSKSPILRSKTAIGNISGSTEQSCEVCMYGVLAIHPSLLKTISDHALQFIATDNISDSL